MHSEYIFEAIELLKNLISIPSISKNETIAADLLETFMKERNLAPKRIGNNLYCKSDCWDKHRPTLLLNAHLDTVKPAKGWIRDPFTAIQEKDLIYGLGSNDDGGSLVSLLQVFRIITTEEKYGEKQLDYNYIFLASCEEEISGKNGIELVLPSLPHIDLALVGEPTGMQPAIAEKGLMVIDAIARGVSGHAARNEGINALYKAIDDINWLRSYTFPKESPLLGPVKMTTTMIKAGSQHNVIPDECSFTIDIRSNEYYSNENIFEMLKQNLKSELKARSFRLNSSQFDYHHPFIKKIQKLGRTPFGSPTLSDQALMPFPSFKMGPGESSRSHTADEFIKQSEIEEAITLYYQILTPSFS